MLSFYVLYAASFHLNTLMLSDAYMCMLTRPSLIQWMTCNLLRAMPLSELICWLNFNQTLGNKYHLNFYQNEPISITNAFDVPILLDSYIQLLGLCEWYLINYRNLYEIFEILSNQFVMQTVYGFADLGKVNLIIFFSCLVPSHYLNQWQLWHLEKMHFSHV